MPENASLNVEFQNFLAIGKDGLGSPSLGPGSSVREKGKKPVERAKKTWQVKWATHWTGKGERAAEPGEMPWHCHHSIYWHQVLISCYDWSNVSMLTNLRCCWQMKYHAQTLVVPQSWGISLWIDLVVLHQWHTAYFPLKHLYFAYVTSSRRIQTFLTKMSY